MPRLDRLTSILIQLQSKRIVRAQEIAERFEISLRTVYRDIRTLEQAGVPIISEAGVGYSLVKEYRLPPVHFTEEEAFSFITAGKLIETLTDPLTRKAYETALFKIKAVLAHGQKELVDDISDRIEVVEDQYLPKNRHEQLDISSFLKAINEKRLIRIGYEDVNTLSVSERVVEPVGIYSQWLHWYLIAYCRLRDDYRTFRADRIRGYEILSDRFDLKHPELKTFIHKQNQKKELQQVVILLDKEARGFLGDQPYYHGFIEQKDAGEQVEMHFLTGSLPGFAHWFLMLGQSADIISPLELKQMVHQKLMAISERLG